MIDNTNYAAAAARYFEEAYELLEQHKSAYALTAARRSLEALVYDLCQRNNIDTRDETGRTYTLESLINELMDIDCIDGENVEHIRIIRQNGNRGVHVTGNAQGEQYAIANETIQRLAIVLDYFAPPGVKNSPLQSICMAEKYAAAGKITKAETICQNILKECWEDVLLQARVINCLSKICGRDAEGTRITQTVIDEWADQGVEIAIVAKLLEITSKNEQLFTCSVTPEIEIGKSVRGYVVERYESGQIIVDFCYQEKGFYTDLAQRFNIGDLVSGIVEAQTEQGIRLKNLQCCQKNHCVVVCDALREMTPWLLRLEATESSAVPYFKKWIDKKTAEYELVKTLEPMARAERLRQEQLAAERLIQEQCEREARAREEEAERKASAKREAVRAKRRARTRLALLMIAVALICVSKVKQYLSLTPVDLFEDLEVSFVKCGDEWIATFENNSTNSFVQSVEYYIERTSGQRTVVIKAEYDQKLAKEMECRVTRDSMKYRVTDYEEYTPIDLFADLELSFAKFDDEWNFSYTNHSKNEFVQSVYYFIEESVFEKGDVIHITAAYDSEWAKELKYYVLQETMEYTLSNCDVYKQVKTGDVVNDASKTRMMEEAVDTILSAIPTIELSTLRKEFGVSNAADHASVTQFSAYAYEMYLMVDRDAQWWEGNNVHAEYKNAFIVLVCAQLKIADGEKVLYDGAAYFSVAFTNVYYDEQRNICSDPLIAVTSPLPSSERIYEAVVEGNRGAYTIEKVPLPYTGNVGH